MEPEPTSNLSSMVPLCEGETDSSNVTSPITLVSLSIAYSIIFILTIGGNGIVCFIVFTTKRMRTLTNTFIVNLAVSDIMIGAFCLPFTIIANLLLEFWPFGDFVCRVVSFINAISVFISSFSLMTIAADRYFAIIYPLRPRMTKCQATVALVGIWIFSAVLGLPLFIFSSTQNDPPKCQEEWPNADHQKLYSSVLIVVHFFVPLIVLAFAYFRVAYVIWIKKMPGEAENSRDQRIATSKRKMIKMMITVVIFYGVCWLPFYAVTTALELDPCLHQSPHIQAAFLVCHVLAMSNSCYNPIIYCWMSSKFRLGFKYVFRCCPCVNYEAQPSSRAYMTVRATTCTTTTGVSLRSKQYRTNEGGRRMMELDHRESVPLKAAGDDRHVSVSAGERRSCRT